MKMTSSISALAIVAALVAGGAQAQDSGTTTGTMPNTTAPAAGSDTEMTTPPAATTTPEATMPSTAPANSDTSASADTATSPRFVEMQQDGQWLASDLMDADIRGQGDEEFGDVKDVVLGEDGTPSAVVIGVGGFLGIGEKNVAVPFDRLTVNTEDGDADDLQLVLDSSKEELEQAPAFRSLADAEAQASTGSSEGVTAPTGATGTMGGAGTTGTMGGSDAGTGGATTPPATTQP